MIYTSFSSVLSQVWELALVVSRPSALLPSSRELISSCLSLMNLPQQVSRCLCGLGSYGVYGKHATKYALRTTPSFLWRSLQKLFLMLENGRTTKTLRKQALNVLLVKPVLLQLYVMIRLFLPVILMQLGTPGPVFAAWEISSLDCLLCLAFPNSPNQETCLLCING